jgi:hypothetical protein
MTYDDLGGCCRINNHGETKIAQAYASGLIQKILLILPILFKNEKTGWAGLAG